MADPTQEKDVDISGNRDTSNNVDRASVTGSDDKTKTFGSTTSLKEDIGEAEAVASNLAEAKIGNSSVMGLAQLQALRHAEEMFDARRRREGELDVIRQRQLSNAADWDQSMREAMSSHIKSRNSQDVKHADLATDRQWNVDEQGYQVTKILEAMGVDNRAVLAMLLDSLSKNMAAGK